MLGIMKRLAQFASRIFALLLAAQSMARADGLAVCPPEHYKVSARPAGLGGEWQSLFRRETVCKTFDQLHKT
jgi:hypothetical protein